MNARGLRNKNPGNIRKGDKWEGLAKEQTDPSFARFTDMHYGCRALIKTLRTYVEKHKLRTVREIISRWAPPSENDTESYIRSVSWYLSVEPDERLDFKFHPFLYTRLAMAIARQENGTEAELISYDTWKKGAVLAGLA